MLFRSLSDNDDNKNPTQQDLNERLYRSFEEADIELNRIYKHLMVTLSAEKKTALKIEQRAWLKDRDPKCRKEADEESGGGSMWGMSYHACREIATRARIGELEKWK